MKKVSELTYINLEDLKLDIKNPRFAELYTGSTNENDLIEYLLYDEAAEEVAKGIINASEFYEYRALWVIKDSDGKYLVKDGNRRCAAAKALQIPGRFRLDLPKITLDKLPVYEFYDINDLMSRITQEHANSLFREWGRIAKALQILELADAGKSDEMNQLDSRPGDFIKIGSFYKAAVIHGKDDFKKQLTRGRGKTGGKTIIYERLFKYRKECGYHFKNSPNFNIVIDNPVKFELYIKALVKYLKIYPNTNYKDIDNDTDFLKRLKDYGFYFDTENGNKPKIDNILTSDNSELDKNNNSTRDSRNTNTTLGTSNSSGISSKKDYSNAKESTNDNASLNEKENPINEVNNKSDKRGSTKKYPDIKRKKLHPHLKARIDEYFKNLDSQSTPNAKMAMARVLYECVLKYTIDQTKHKNTILKNSGHFGSAYKGRYTDFNELNKKFIELITDIGIRKAFINFDIEKMHQVIHNYNLSGKGIDAEEINNNLIPLIEFMLQDEPDLLSSLNLSKI